MSRSDYDLRLNNSVASNRDGYEDNVDERLYGYCYGTNSAVHGAKSVIVDVVETDGKVSGSYKVL
jgi:hypothetical protein